ncbi:MAG: hypothetical protein EOO25_21520 [Comamonadaceae bacterium]|nr:MAG: hypothetical protein EOO25_21520 [Comamonadaceae bacterium]
MNTNKSIRAGADSVHTLADNALHASETALDHTRQLASQALERAGERLHDVRLGARDLTVRGIGAVGDRAVAAQRQIGRYAEATGRYVSDQPLKSALIAAAAGALLAGVLIAARRRSRRNGY